MSQVLIGLDQFSVIGERIITVGAIVQLVVQVKITPPKAHKGQTNVIPSLEEEDDISKPTQVVKAAEQSTNELIGRKVKGADGEVENYWAHAPRFPNVGISPSSRLSGADQCCHRTANPAGTSLSLTTNLTGFTSRLGISLKLANRLSARLRCKSKHRPTPACTLFKCMSRAIAIWARISERI